MLDSDPEGSPSPTLSTSQVQTPGREEEEKMMHWSREAVLLLFQPWQRASSCFFLPQSKEEGHLLENSPIAFRSIP